MDDLPRQKLRAILSAHGRAVCRDPEQLGALLTKVCPDHPREVQALYHSLDSLLADDFLASLGERPWRDFADPVINQLVTQHSMTKEDASWATNSWGIALGEITTDQSDSPASGGPAVPSSPEGPASGGKPSAWEERKPAPWLPAPTPEGSQKPGMQAKTVLIMAIAIVVGLIALLMVSRTSETMRGEALYQRQPASYWSKKLQEPIQRKEVQQGTVKMMKDVDPAGDLRRGDPDAVLVLIDLLEDKNPIVRQEAILILARIGNPAKQAIPALQKALNDPNEQVRFRAMNALRTLELPSGN
jgi:hypothetical protein